jgi:flavin-dependent dehydrogenase
VGAYFTDVQGLADRGEMHVRPGCYVGVAPLPGGLVNLCAVTDDRLRLRPPAALIGDVLRGEPELADRFRGARMEGRTACLGPLAVECRMPGATGLVLAGDAAGFVDPMTGDGLRLAIRGAELAAGEVVRALESGDRAAHVHLARARAREFGGKLRFNRVLRQLAGSEVAVQGAAYATRLSSWPLRRIINYVGDVPLA